MMTRLLIIIGIIILSVGISIGVFSQIDLYDYDKYHTVFGPNSPLAEIGTGNPVLTRDNCERYAYWLTEHQKEKITLLEDFSVRYPPWGNQIFPLVDYCTKTGQLDKTVINGMLKWKFNPVRQGMQGLPSEPESEPIDDFEKTWGGPGNRHPAFLGFDIPEICTDDMIKHLAQYSSMFDKNAPYSLDWISMDDSIDRGDFDRCVDELLKINKK